VRTRRLALALAIVGILTAFTWQQSIQQVPDGQAPLVTLDASSLAELQAEFNQGADRTRIIVLLAPT
jgi:hypothetical protein